MGKPTEREMQAACNKAQQMLNEQDNPHHIASIFIMLCGSVQLMETLLAAAERYLAGASVERSHSELLEAAEQVRNAVQSLPDEAHLAEALQYAAKMREHDDDPDFLAKALLNMNYRYACYKHLWEAVEHYLHSGCSGTERDRLLEAVDSVHEVEKRTAGLDNSTYGLE